MVIAAFAPGHRGGVLQSDDLIQRQHGGLFFTGHVETFFCDQCCAESSHDTGNVRADCTAARDLLKAAKNGVIIEGTALHNYMFSKIRGVGDLDHLK